VLDPAQLASSGCSFSSCNGKHDADDNSGDDDGEEDEDEDDNDDDS
jgi:hypothetical protein